MTRIDHSGHDHPATPAARAACRKVLADVNRPIGVGDVVMAKLDDAPERLAEVVSIEPWGNSLRYNCRFASGWVIGTCKVRRP